MKNSASAVCEAIAPPLKICNHGYLGGPNPSGSDNGTVNKTGRTGNMANNGTGKAGLKMQIMVSGKSVRREMPLDQTSRKSQIRPGSRPEFPVRGCFKQAIKLE